MTWAWALLAALAMFALAPASASANIAATDSPAVLPAVGDPVVLDAWAYPVGNAYVWRAGMAIDADGAPGAYGPPGRPGLDALGNAGREGNWWGVVTDTGKKDGAPVVGPDGYYISTTALVDHARQARDQARYVDASTVSFLAIGRDVLSALGAALGDLAWVIGPDGETAAIVADLAPAGHMAEASIACAERTGVPSSPRTGGIKSGVTYVLFPGTSTGWPRDFEDEAARLYRAIGGRAAVDQVPT